MPANSAPLPRPWRCARSGAARASQGLRRRRPPPHPRGRLGRNRVPYRADRDEGPTAPDSAMKVAPKKAILRPDGVLSRRSRPVQPMVHRLVHQRDRRSAGRYGSLREWVLGGLHTTPACGLREPG